MNGSHIARASQGYDQVAGDITVDLSMNDEGMEQWSRMTSENINRLVAITMDNVVYSAPQVRGAINQGNTQISGSFTFDEANDLAGLHLHFRSSHFDFVDAAHLAQINSNSSSSS